MPALAAHAPQKARAPSKGRAEKPRQESSSAVHVSPESLRGFDRPHPRANAGGAGCTCGGICPRCRGHAAHADRHARVAHVLETPGEPLDVARRSRMESLLGADLGHVRMHRGAEAAASARHLGAFGYAFGPHVVVDESRDPSTRDVVLAHELVHVVQQRDAPSAAFDRASPQAFDSRAEREARAIGQNAARRGAPAHFRPRERTGRAALSLADPAAVGRVMGLGTTANTGLQFWPTNVVDTQVGPPPVHGGLINDQSSRLNVIIGPNITLRLLARALLPLWTTATPFTSPATGLPVPLEIINEDQLARALAVFNQFYLPLATMANWRAGLRLPLPVFIDEATGIATLHPSVIASLATAFDAARAPALDTPAPAAVAAAPADLAQQATDFLARETDALARGIHLGARAITNAVAERPFVEEVFRQLGAGGFDVALEFMNFLVNRQIGQLASQADGAAILQVITNALAAPPAGLSADRQDALTRANGMLGRAAAIPARATPTTPVATGVVFSESPAEMFAGFDASTAPRWLTIPVGETRIADVTVTPATAVPNFVSTNTGVATVATTPSGIQVTGVADGTSVIRAMAGATEVGRLRIETKSQRARTTAFHFVSDSAVPPNVAAAAPTSADMLALLNGVWQRQANVNFTQAGADNPIVAPGDMGDAVDSDGFGGGEMGTVTALGSPANYRVFRVWHVRSAGNEVNGGLNNGINTLISDRPCGDGLGLAHEAGHAMGRDHPEGGIMSPCGVRVDQRVPHQMADQVNP